MLEILRLFIEEDKILIEENAQKQKEKEKIEL